MLYVIWVDEGDGFYVYKHTNHWPDVEKALVTFEDCFYDIHTDEEYEEN